MATKIGRREGRQASTSISERINRQRTSLVAKVII